MKQNAQTKGRRKIEETYSKLVEAVQLLTKEIQSRQEQEKVEKEEMQAMKKLRKMQVI